MFPIKLAPTINVFLPGHKLRGEISSSNFPRFDPNLNTAGEIFCGTKQQGATKILMHYSPYPSRIVLQIIPR